MRSMTVEFSNRVGQGRKAFKGELQTTMTLTENDDGTITVSLSVTGESNLTGDIRGFFFDVPDHNLLPGLSITGEHINSTQFEADSIFNLGWGAHLKTSTAIQYGLFDAGAEIGTWGYWDNDIHETTFVISHDSQPLTLDMFAGMDFAISVTDIGQEGAYWRVDSINPATTLGYAPDAVDDVYTVDAGSDLSGDLLANDTDADSGRLVVESVEGGDVGRWFEATTEGGRTVEIRIRDNGRFEIRNYEGFENLLQGEADTLSLTYTLSDGQGGRDTAEFRVSIGGTVSVDVNDAPVASPLDIITLEDTVLDGRLVAQDADGDVLTYSLLSGPAHGSVTVEADGTFSYTPSLDYSGSDSFTYLVDDGNGGTGSATVSLSIRAVNDAPVVVDDAFAIDAGGRLNNNLLANDSDVDSRRLRIDDIEGGRVGRWFAETTDGGRDVMVRVLAGGRIEVRTQSRDFSDLYQGETDTLSLEYTVTDRDGGFTTGDVTVTINGTVPPPVGNEAPVAQPLDVTVDEDGVLEGQLSASDAEGDALTYVLANPPANGSVAVHADGSFTYTPDAHFNGADAFTYTVTDGNGGTDTATVSVGVTAVNDAPVAEDASVEVVEDGSVNGTLAASDIDADALAFGLFTDAANGSVVVNADGTYTYTPDGNFAGTDSFTYSVSDGNGGTDTATISISVIGGNDAPIAQDGTFSVDEDGTLSAAVTASDDEGDALTFSLDADAAHGTVSFNADGTFTYTPNADYNGADSFTWTVSDGNGGIDSGVVTISVNPVNDAPVAADAAYEVAEDGSLNGTLYGADIDGDALAFALETAAANGTISLGANGTFTYTPDVNFSGTDTFTYTVSDGQGGVDTATITVTVTPENDAPVLADTSFSVDENSAAGTVLGTLAASDAEDAPSALSYTVTGGTGAGVFTVDATGTISIATGAVLNHEAASSYSLTVEVTDSEGAADTATVTISVANVNEAPDALAGYTVTDAGMPVSGQLVASDPDAGDALTFTLLSTPANGTITIDAATGAFTYTPNEGFVGTELFAFAVQDSGGLTDTAGFQIDVAPGGPGTIVGTSQPESVVSALYNVSAPEVTGLADGGHLLVWGALSAPGDDSGYGVFAQRYDVLGAKLGGEFLVNTTTANDQTLPAAAGLVDGGYVVVWQSYLQDGSEQGVYGRYYDADGNAGDEFLITTTTAGNQTDPCIAALDNGGFVVSWTGQEPGNTFDDVYTRVFSKDTANGGFTAGDEFVTNVTYTFADQETLGYKTETVANIGEGRFVVVWTERWESDGRGPSVMARIFNEDGTPIPGSETEFRVNSTTNSYERFASVGTLENGNFVVVWDASPEGTNGIYAKIYTPDGTPLTGDHTLDGQFRLDNGTASAGNAKVAGLADGSFYAVWEVNPGGMNYDIVGRHFGADGQPLSDQIRINQTYLGGQIDVTLDVTEDGSVVVAWRDNYNGGLWQKILELDSGAEAKDLTGTEADDILIGSDLDDWLRGEGGDDVLYGEGGMDRIWGGEGSDTFVMTEWHTFDMIADFETGGVDKIDISQLLFATDFLIEAIDDYVKLEEINGNTMLSIDSDGAGTAHAAQPIAWISQVTGLVDAQTMLDNGELIVATNAAVV